LTGGSAIFSGTAGAYLYPWDVAGDPAAGDLAAGLGLTHVTLAAVYHAVRALTPRHPEHRFVVAPHSAAYFPLSRTASGPLRLSAAHWLADADSFGSAAGTLRAAGLPVYAWVVLGHVDAPEATPFSVVNAFGDAYPWALCPAWDEVVEYATGVADEVSALDGLAGVELEACGWYGWEHQCTHDKVPVTLTPAERYLLSLCFCVACDAGYRVAGIDPSDLRRRVRTALDRALRGAALPQPAGDDSSDQIARLLGPDVSAVADVRRAVADRLRSAVVARIRARRPEWTIALHASPESFHTTSFTGVDLAHTGRIVDELVVNCWAGGDVIGPSLAAGVPVHASLLAVAGLASQAKSLSQQVDEARATGADGVRLYHAGLASDRDLDAIRAIAWSAKT
jgi:hypothetical protein